MYMLHVTTSFTYFNESKVRLPRTVLIRTIRHEILCSIRLCSRNFDSVHAFWKKRFEKFAWAKFKNFYSSESAVKFEVIWYTGCTQCATFFEQFVFAPCDGPCPLCATLRKIFNSKMTKMNENGLNFLCFRFHLYWKVTQSTQNHFLMTHGKIWYRHIVGFIA